MTEQEKAQRRAAAVAAAQAAIDSAPSTNKARYVRLPPTVKRYEPKAGVTKKAFFLQWIAGPLNPTFKKGTLAWNRFHRVHSRIGPNDEHFGCAMAIGKPCAVCEMFQYQKTHGEKSKQFWDTVLAPLKIKNREFFLLHFIDDDDPKNIYFWDESPSLFGDKFRGLYTKRAAWMAFLDPEVGCVVEINPVEKKIGQGSCVDCGEGIIIESLEKPINPNVVATAKKLCPDDWVIWTPYADLKRFMDNTGGATEEEATEVVEEPVAEEEATAEEETSAEEETTTEEPAAEEETATEEETPAEEEEVVTEEEEVVEEVVEEEPEPEPESPPPPKKPAAKPAVPAKPATKPAPAKPAVPAKPPVKPAPGKPPTRPTGKK